MSIFLGIWAGIFISGLSNGMNNQRIDNFLSTSTSHIQIHNADYLKDKELKHKLFQFSDLKAALDKKYDEIAETLGISSVNARVKMNRIKKRLKEMINDRHDGWIEIIKK